MMDWKMSGSNKNDMGLVPKNAVEATFNLNSIYLDSKRKTSNNCIELIS